MEGSGKEGETIILMALRQVGCPIPDEVEAISDVVTRPELLVRPRFHKQISGRWGFTWLWVPAFALGDVPQVELVVRSLWLISDGNVKFPAQLPPGIAARHRICTLIASKIKDLGYLGAYKWFLLPWLAR
jgi:hypothetical protein